MPPTTPSQGPGNGEAASHPPSGETPRPARQYRPGRGRHVENTIMSALVRAGRSSPGTALTRTRALLIAAALIILAIGLITHL